MADKYFALVWENLSKPWAYFINDSEDLDDLKLEILEMQKAGNLNPNARIKFYGGELIEG